MMVRSYGIQTWHEGTLMHGIYRPTHGRFDDLGLDVKSQWLGREKESALNDLNNDASDKN